MTAAPECELPPLELMACFYAESADADQALAVGRALLNSLAGFSPQCRGTPERYWKIPGWYEHTLDLAPGTEAAFDDLLKLADGGSWDVVRDGECWAVWNGAEGGLFLLPEVKWAHILLNRPNPPADDQHYEPL